MKKTEKLKENSIKVKNRDDAKKAIGVNVTIRSNGDISNIKQRSKEMELNDKEFVIYFVKWSKDISEE